MVIVNSPAGLGDIFKANSSQSRVWTDIAALINKDPPPRVTTLLREWGPSIMLDRAVHAAQPSKTQMRKRLTQVANAAAIVREALQHDPTREFLELEGNVRIENLGGLELALRTIGEHATSAAASPRISASGTAAKKGQGKALPAEALHPKVFCAVIIGETWKFLNGEYPGSRNAKAAAAADAYWQASGGSTKSWGTNRLTSWRPYFERAKSPAAEKIRREVHRHCIEYSRQESIA
jgi:hypothetical protein